jgi:hypothetical protein
VEHEFEYARLVQRRSDYDELLRMGFVVVRADDPDGWRRRLKANARADKVHVRTGNADADDHVVWAYLKHLDRQKISQEELHERFRHGDAIREAMSRAFLRGHTVDRVIRAEGTRAAAACQRCRARLYVDSASDPPFVEGEVFDVDCPTTSGDST